MQYQGGKSRVSGDIANTIKQFVTGGAESEISRRKIKICKSNCVCNSGTNAQQGGACLLVLWNLLR